MMKGGKNENGRVAPPESVLLIMNNLQSTGLSEGTSF